MGAENESSNGDIKVQAGKIVLQEFFDRLDVLQIFDGPPLNVIC
jgi:hypothetical protein